VYSPLFSGVFWDAQEVPLEDVERIEVISGAGGTLWGANAVNGVINVITRSAQESPGWLAAARAGTTGNEATGRYGGRRPGAGGGPRPDDGGVGEGGGRPAGSPAGRLPRGLAHGGRRVHRPGRPLPGRRRRRDAGRARHVRREPARALAPRRGRRRQLAAAGL